MKVGDSFSCIEDLRTAFELYALKNCLSYRVKKSETEKYSAVCNLSPDTCSFKFFANLRRDGRLYVTTAILNHDDFCPALANTARSKALASAVTEDLAAIKTFTPKDVVETTRMRYGISVPYCTAWFALNRIKRTTQAEENESFKMIANLFTALAAANPETRHSIDTDGLGRFVSAFLCPSYAVAAFENSFPALILDACHLKSRFGGVLFAATVMDGLRRILPIAIFVAPTENEANWRSFLEQIKSAVPSLAKPGIIFCHDRDKGLHNAQTAIFPEGHEMICLFHLKQNVKAKFGGSFDNLIHETSRKLNVREFESCMNKIKSKSLPVYNYLMDVDPKLWATAHFPTNRFEIYTSNSAESMNSYFEQMRHGSYFHVFTKFVEMISARLYTRRAECDRITTDVPLEIHLKWKEYLREGIRRKIQQNSEEIFTVKAHSVRGQRVVNLTNRSCSCAVMKHNGFMCLHFAAVLNKNCSNYVDFISPAFLSKSLKLVYSVPLIPVPESELLDDEEILPPASKARRGRPCKKRKRSRAEILSCKKYRCGICGQLGHNRNSCVQRDFFGRGSD